MLCIGETPVLQKRANKLAKNVSVSLRHNAAIRGVALFGKAGVFHLIMKPNSGYGRLSEPWYGCHSRRRDLASESDLRQAVGALADSHWVTVPT